MSLFQHIIHNLSHIMLENYERNQRLSEFASHNSRRDFILINQKYYDTKREVDRLIERCEPISQDIYNFFPEYLTRLCQEKHCMHLIEECQSRPEYLIKIKCIWDYHTLIYLANNDKSLYPFILDGYH